MDGKMEILAKIAAAHQQIPNLDMKPTRDNMTIGLFIMQTLEDASAFIRSLPDATPEKPEEPAEGASDNA